MKPRSGDLNYKEFIQYRPNNNVSRYLWESVVEQREQGKNYNNYYRGWGSYTVDFCIVNGGQKPKIRLYRFYISINNSKLNIETTLEK